MSTTIRPELSERNPYYVPKERYLELLHFTRQFEYWVTECNRYDIHSVRTNYDRVQINDVKDNTARDAIRNASMSNKIKMVHKCAFKAVDIVCKGVIRDYQPVIDALIFGIVHDQGYDFINVNHIISRDMYYKVYHCYFWLLNKERD